MVSLGAVYGAIRSVFGGKQVTVSSPTTDQVLKYDGTQWVNAAVPAGGGPFTSDPPDITGTLGATGSFFVKNSSETLNNLGIGNVGARFELEAASTFAVVQSDGNTKLFEIDEATGAFSVFASNGSDYLLYTDADEMDLYAGQDGLNVYATEVSTETPALTVDGATGLTSLKVPCARAHRSGAQTITTGTVTTLAFNASDYAQGITDSGSGAFTIVTAGKYRCTASILWENSATGADRHLGITVNDDTHATGCIAFDAKPGNSSYLTNVATTTYSFAANDVVRGYCYHNKGGDLTITGAAYVFMAIERVSD